MKNLLQKKKEAMFYNSFDMSRFIQGTLQRFYGNRTKYFSPRLSIRYWDKKTQKYFNIGINIDEATRLLFLHAHGNLNCPTAKNDVMGSFISYKYCWPPTSKYNINILKILPILKPIYNVSQKIPPHIHDHICKYRKNDISNNLDKFSSFCS